MRTLTRDSFRRNEDGAAAVEFALIAIILFTILFGIIEFGLYFSQREVFESAAREGARVAAVREADGTVASPAEVSAAIDGAVPAGYDWDSGTLSVGTCTPGDPITVSWQQTFFIEMPLIPAIDFTTPIEGTFRCE